MKILIVGGGGREHALAWKVAQSQHVNEVLVAPGNAGTHRETKVRNVAVKADDLAALLRLAQSERVDLTIVGPEQPLVAGITDRFEAAGLRCFGPTAAAARLEGSKAYTKDFLARHAIPTAASASFQELAPALAYIHDKGAPIVVKADGLAAGKGVIIAETVAEAEAAVATMLEQRVFGSAGATVVLEEFLRGEEASFIAMVDGTAVLPLASSQDHKTRDDGDKGPNTGGMGAYSPAPVMTDALAAEIDGTIVARTLSAMKAESRPFTGILFAGLMITKDGPKLIEFNVRFGDPECQALMLRLRSDLLPALIAACDGVLDSFDLRWFDEVALSVVMASKGYPGAYEKGSEIKGLDAAQSDDKVKVFHAGTARAADGRLLAAGGRVLNVTALGDTVKEAQQRAYAAVDRIDWPGGFCRRDIGWRAVAREG